MTMTTKRVRKKKQTPEQAQRGLAMLDYHMQCIRKHMNIAQAIAREQRVLTNVMYVHHPQYWQPTNVKHYIAQIMSNINYVKQGRNIRTERRDFMAQIKSKREAEL